MLKKAFRLMEEEKDGLISINKEAHLCYQNLNEEYEKKLMVKQKEIECQTYLLSNQMEDSVGNYGKHFVNYSTTIYTRYNILNFSSACPVNKMF